MNSESTVQQLIIKLSQQPESVQFKDVMEVIKSHYNYAGSAFTNGDLINEKGMNEGSCKIFYFAKLLNLSEQQTLACFGEYYRKDVLENPEGKDHGNIRNFMKTGWAGISFTSQALAEN
ncbi:HopJ type III effector protein [Litorilituus lipolyticus]|uniref:Type III effector n=1 Tax=Litorilituus lipolyticus TaxID=2491017 RepID=A0A502L058_9GAMM|nr:HopJ type III effector protein [Litorilituus lipolyticus]TPH15855.1 type III effector [Litorilituus lipolyticus]